MQACVTELNKSIDTVVKFVSHSHFLNSTILCATTKMKTGRVDLEDDLKDVLDEYSLEIEDELRVQVVSLSGQLKEVKTMLAQCCRKIMMQVRLSLSLPPLCLPSTVRP